MRGGQCSLDFTLEKRKCELVQGRAPEPQRMACKHTLVAQLPAQYGLNVMRPNRPDLKDRRVWDPGVGKG